MTTNELIKEEILKANNPATDEVFGACGERVVVESNETTINITLIVGYPMRSLESEVSQFLIQEIHKISDGRGVEVAIKLQVVAHAAQSGLKLLPNIRNVIAIASGKGGVGKSTVTSNLAVSLAKMGFTVGLLDADIYGPSIPIMFDVAEERPKSIIIEGKSKMEPVENYGVKILSIGFFTKSDQAVIWRGPMASKALNQMIFDANWGELDFLLIDLPPGTGDIHLSILQALPITGSVIVSTPQNVALADAKKGVAMFKQDLINIPVLGIIENMSYFTPKELPENKYYIFGKDGAKNLADDLEVPFIGCIPLIQSVREAGDFGRPVAMQEETIISEELKKITQNIVSEVIKRNKDLPASEAIKITTMAGCSAVNK